MSGCRKRAAPESPQAGPPSKQTRAAVAAAARTSAPDSEPRISATGVTNDIAAMAGPVEAAAPETAAAVERTHDSSAAATSQHPPGLPSPASATEPSIKIAPKKSSHNGGQPCYSTRNRKFFSVGGGGTAPLAAPPEPPGSAIPPRAAPRYHKSPVIGVATHRPRVFNANASPNTPRCLPRNAPPTAPPTAAPQPSPPPATPLPTPADIAAQSAIPQPAIPAATPAEKAAQLKLVLEQMMSARKQARPGSTQPKLQQQQPPHPVAAVPQQRMSILHRNQRMEGPADLRPPNGPPPLYLPPPSQNAPQPDTHPEDAAGAPPETLAAAAGSPQPRSQPPHAAVNAPHQAAAAAAAAAAADPHAPTTVACGTAATEPQPSQVEPPQTQGQSHFPLQAEFQPASQSQPRSQHSQDAHFEQQRDQHQQHGLHGGGKNAGTHPDPHVLQQGQHSSVGTSSAGQELSAQQQADTLQPAFEHHTLSQTGCPSPDWGETQTHSLYSAPRASPIPPTGPAGTASGTSSSGPA
ncbi:MAG: hypothetical protein WDW38_003603 [Sanguina aurantia]